ncbi:MAG: DUF302 domain-containing protein [Actinomycetota bacterium]|nr:DUF302 domain-containing protein [Actinomycetota bacterium]
MVETKEPIIVPFSKFELEVREGIAWPDGPKVQIRAVSPGDEDGLREMLSRLSRESINKRFHLPMPRVPEWALAYLIDIGNPFIANQMLEHVAEVGLYVPVRVYVHEDERGQEKTDLPQE